MNLGTLTTLAASMAQDAQQSRYSGLFTQAINTAQQQFALDAKCLFKDSSITVVAGTAAYSLPTDFMWEKKVTYKQLLLEPVSRQSLETYKADDWTDDTGDPRAYIVDPEEARKTITVYPYPPSGDAGGTLVLTYYCLPTDLSNATDTPLNAYALLAQYHIGIAAYAAWLLLQNEQDTAEIIAKKRELLQVYNDQVSLASSRFQNTVSEPWRMRGTRGTSF